MSETNNQERKGLWLGGLPWWQAVVAVLLCLVPAYITKTKMVDGAEVTTMLQATSMTGALAICFGFAVLFNEIGERIPIWNTYVGGGLLFTFFGVAILRYYGILPAPAIDAIKNLVPKGTKFLEFFIVILIVGSVMSLEKDIMLKSFAGYIPAILGGLAVAALFGVLVGGIFGVAPKSAVIKYVLPIMGGGNGAGAVPLSEIYQSVTGDDAANYYSFAIIILTIANMFCILAAAGLNALGKAVPVLTGDKKTLIRGGEGREIKDANVKVDNTDFAGALLLTCACFSFGRLMSKQILPKIAGANIHPYAYMIIFVVILAGTGLIPARTRVAAKKLQSFFAGKMSLIIMVGMGATFKLEELFNAVSPSNMIIALVIVIGAIIGSGGVGYLVGFYPIDSAITAGLCMANRGGSGDIACLGAADRMDLIAYSQLSSRLGGGIVLIVASFVFSFWL